MLEIRLPITSIFKKKDSKISEHECFVFKLLVNEDFDSIYLKKLDINPDIKYQHEWLTCFEPERHLDSLTKLIYEKYIKKNIKSNLNIFGYSFKDDSSLKRMESLIKNNHTVKTSKNIGLPVEGVCLNALFKFTNINNLKQIARKNGKADIFFVRHVLEHNWNINLFLKSLKELLHKESILIIEIPDSEKALKQGLHTMLWEEHTHYFTEETILKAVLFNSFEIIEFHRYSNRLEDSLVLILKKSLKKNLRLKKGYKKVDLLKEYTKNFKINKEKIKNKIIKIISSGYKICLFGAGHHASSFVSINNLENYISYVIDDNFNKHDYLLPGSKIPILPSINLSKEKDLIKVFLTTNPESDQKIKNSILKLNDNLKIDSIFNFYKF